MSDENEKSDGSWSGDYPRWFKRAVFVLFFWIMFGISLIYGARLFNNNPMHPSFLPVAGAAFAASLSFVIVMVFDQFGGQLVFKVPPLTVEGASGPILLWCICFLSIAIGLSLLGFASAVTADYPGIEFEPILKLF